jgi:TolB-like protein
LALALIAPGAAAFAAQRVAIIPFTANSQEDVSYLVRGVRDMLASRLAWQDQVVVMEPSTVNQATEKVAPPYDETKARQIGRELHADVVVFGSITVLGQSISVDARVIKTAGNEGAFTSFLQAQGIDQVVPQVNEFAARINREVFQRADTPGQPQPAAAAAPPASDDPVENLPESMSPLNPLFLRTLSGIDSDRYWRSPRINKTLQSIAVDDVDGNGKNELVVLTKDSLRIYRLVNDTFAMAQEIKNGPSGSYMFVDTIDIKGTGVPQIVVTNRNFRTMGSFLVEWNGKSFQITEQDLPYYFRAQINPSGPGKILLAQKTSVNEPFWGPVYQMTWDNKDGLVPLKTIDVPRQGGYIYSIALADLEGNGTVRLVMVGLDFTLRVFNSSATQEIWSSGETYATSTKFIDYAGGIQGTTELDPTRWWIAGRIEPFVIDESGRQEILIVRNDDRAGGFLERSKFIFQGAVIAMYWNGISMIEHWRTPMMGGSINDQTIADVANVGRKALIMAMGQRSLQGLGEAESGNVVAFTLKPQTPLPRSAQGEGL